MNRLLIIEDNASLAKSLKDYFSKEGYEVMVVYQLSEAKNLTMTFNLIILDWMLPDGQGIDFLKTLRSQCDWIPVIFLTAKAQATEVQLGLSLGAIGYVLKPFDPMKLHEEIEHILNLKNSGAKAA